jgi:hypothetical protein
VSDILADLKSVAPRVMADLDWVECGPGWHDLLRDLVRGLESLPDPPSIVRLKSKFGGLRCHLESPLPDADAIIRAAEARSFVTCESCGEKGEPRSRRGWIVTTCDACFEAGA